MATDPIVRGAGTPVPVRWAAVALAGYALVVLGNATVLQVQSGWEGVADYPRALLRVGGVAVVAWGLLRRARWAWWLGVGLPLFWVLSSLFGVATLLRLRTPETEALLPPSFFVTLGATIGLLSAAVVLLCIQSSSAAFRDNAV